MVALLIHPLPHIFLADIECSRDMPHQIGDQKAVGFVAGAPLRWMQVTDDLAALIGEHADRRT